ncbi:MAG: type III-B CRISPR-associated protein Cas10/Cmr2 [Cyanobacteria bacterium J06635_10]
MELDKNINQSCYTVMTYAPVQGFIEKSRKLRDLYGSSYLLSYISWVICNAAENHGCKVVSPASTNVTQGMPNQIIIEGNFPENEAKSVLLKAWKCITETCREWIETNVEVVEDKKVDYTPWRRTWGLWTKYAWEFFWVQGNENQRISDVRKKLNEKKRARDWTGINWQGESSTLSGADAIAYPKLGFMSDPREYNYQQERKDVRDFYTALSEKLGESFIKSVGLNVPDEKMSERSQEYGKSFIDPDEELSVPELIKRLITHKAIAIEIKVKFNKVFEDNEVLQGLEILSEDLNPERFTDLNRLKKTKLINDDKQLEQHKFFQGWFQGDGDKAGKYLQSFANKPEESDKTAEFSLEMMKWGDYFKKLPESNKIPDWRVVYAGGDDFLGVFYNRKDAIDCVNFFSSFKQDIWQQKKTSKKERKKITVSVGFVWAFPDIPQRDVLQHCREAEKSAKNNGRDRIAFRILFNNGSHLEWFCPWWLLESGLLDNYRDRDKDKGKAKQNWTHIYNDVVVLESRHAFDGDGLDVALGLFEIYFPDYVDIIKDEQKQLHPKDANLTEVSAGILGEKHIYYQENSQKVDQIKVNKALTDWIINLAKVGFHLCQQ